jgi:hypothetical protein
MLFLSGRAGRPRISSGLELLKFPKNKDFAGCLTGNSVSFPIAGRMFLIFVLYEDEPFYVLQHHRSS